MSVNRVTACALIVSVVMLTGACASVPPSSEVDSVSATPTAVVDPFGPRPNFIEGGSATENKPLFDWVLNHAVLDDNNDPGIHMAKSLVQAGFAKNKIELTESFSGTGNPADQIVISVRVGSSCLIGQRMLDTTFSSSIESALQSGGCLIGDTRKITW